MCTRFVYSGEDIITGFNFDINLDDWEHKVLKKDDRFFIGIKQPDNEYHSYHGINKNGNVGTLLYVHGNEAGMYNHEYGCITVSDLTEKFIKNELSFEDATRIAKTKKITYAPDATMQAMLSDINGNALIIEPGIGYRVEHQKYSLITNYSVLNPESTREFINPGDGRYERAKQMLESSSADFSVDDAFSILKSVREKGLWATRVSFVYSVKQQKAYYALDSNFGRIYDYNFFS
ncbi:MAG: conjugal transfer protein [Clostridiales bacterium]|jgi:hypothetical protein|nr:conjugal transfer protein [Clostridiales bacterium]